VVFTGGIVPGLWRPIAGIDAYDLREHEIDITAWVPSLVDGNTHNFEIRVASLNDDGAGHATIAETPTSYWLVTGKIFIFLDSAGSITTGSSPVIQVPAPQLSISSSVTQNSAGVNETLTYMITATRQVSITSVIKTSTGSRIASWTQSLSYTNYNAISSQGLVQYTDQTTAGSDASTSGYSATYAYPITVSTSYYVSPSNAVSINGSISRVLNLTIAGPAIFPTGLQALNTTAPATLPISLPNPAGAQSQQAIPIRPLPALSVALLRTNQTGTAGYHSAANGSYSFGTTTQDLSFRGVAAGSRVDVEVYSRHVKAVNATVVEDRQTLVGVTVQGPTGVPGGGEGLAVGGASIRAMLGRGPET
jgi:hypothetical protein